MGIIRNEYLAIYSTKVCYEIDREREFVDYYPKDNLSSVIESLRLVRLPTVKARRLGRLFQ